MTINANTGSGTKEVKVATPCNCGKKWFNCGCSLITDTYDVEVIDTVINPAHLAFIRKAHPGMTLIY